MSGFCAVNIAPLAVPEPPSSRLGEENTVTTPTTPRATRFVFPEPAPAAVEIDEATVKTPTKESFASIGSKLPPTAEPEAHTSHSRTDSKLEVSRPAVSREGSHRSTKSLDSSNNSPDLDMKRELDEGLASDNESVQSDSGPPSKKKKGQRFFCTDFPPCQLSFTRSEHLARHIRKHTGERPFQCHCGRRFSRLDNLRQHAQTVHVNEDIPTESLAATGTRFQRQIRTDRVRPPASRSRASTFSSQGSFTRGHSRNLSASSIASVSTTSSISDDIRSRPSSLIENSARSRLSIETFNPAVTGAMNVAQYYAVGGPSPNGYSTPMSNKLTGNNGSPRFSSAFQSPTSVPRNLVWGSQTPGRRLSVPSSNPFQGQLGHSYSASNITPLSSFAPSIASGQSSLYASPTSSTFDASRRGSIAAAAADEEIRRRTWHPSTRTGVDGQRPGTSGLGVYQTVESARSVSPQKRHSHQTSITRLPGIESFDHAPPKTSIVRPPSPMEVDVPARPALVPSLSERRIAALPVRRHQHHVSWDTALHRGLTKLELNSTAPPPAAQPAWQYHPSGPKEVLMSRQGTTPNPGFQTQPTAPTSAPQAVQPPPQGDRIRFSDEPVVPTHRSKRHAWYNGPIREHVAETNMSGGPGPVQIMHTHHAGHHSEHVRTSSDDSASSEGVATPSSAHRATFLPAVVHHPSGGFDPHHQQMAQHLPALHELAEQKVAFAAGPGPTIIEEEEQHPHQQHRREVVPLPMPMPRAAPAVQHVLSGSRPPSWPLPVVMEQPHSLHQQEQQGGRDMRRLEALVAVATGESGR